MLTAASGLPAQVVFSDLFEKPGASAESGWYVRGGNLEETSNVRQGNLTLSRKLADQPVPRASGIWKSFPTVTLGANESLRLTIKFSGAETQSHPFFRIVLADSPEPVESNGPLLNETAERTAYVLALPAGNQAPLPDDNSMGFIEATADAYENRPRITGDLVSFSKEPTIQPIFQERMKVLTSEEYSPKAELIWELTNDNGVIVSKGSWKGADGNRIDMLEVRAENVQHFEFNKIGIAFAVWDKDWADNHALVDSVSIDSIQLEKIPKK
jgi:hypothetical protein